MNDEEEILNLLDEQGVEPTPEPEPNPATEPVIMPNVDNNGVQTVSDSDVETVDEGGVQTLPDVAPPAPAAAPPPGKMSDDIPLLLAQGATFGGREEIIGGLYGAVEGAKNLPQGPGAALKAAKAKYEQVMADEHNKTQEARARSPYLSVGLEALGSTAAPMMGVVGGMGKGLVGMVGTGMANAAVTGALESPGDRVGGALRAAPLGGLIPAAVGGAGKLATSGLAATGAGMLAPGLDTALYADLLRNPALRQQTLSARSRYPDIAAAGEQVGDLLGDTIGAVRSSSVASKMAGNEALIQQGFLDKPLDNAVNYVERKLQFAEMPENALNYSAEIKQTLQKALANLKGYFPNANKISGKVAQRNALDLEIKELQKKLQLAQTSANKSALMKQRAAKLETEIQNKQAKLDPLAKEVDDVLINGYHEARQDLDDVIDWDSDSNIRRPSRADQEIAKETRDYIDSVMKTSKDWRVHDEVYATWAPLEKALKKQIMEAGGTGNVSYKKVWSLISGAGGDASAADKKRLLDEFSDYVTKNFSNNLQIMDKLQKFQKMTQDLTLAKRFQGMGAATGTTTGRIGAAIANPTRFAASPVFFPTVFLQALDKANTAKEFLEKIHPALPTGVRNRVIIMVNQALKQKPDLSVEEAAKIVQNQVQQGEQK